MGLEAHDVPSSIRSRPATTNTPDVTNVTLGHLPDSTPAARADNASITAYSPSIPSASFTQQPKPIDVTIGNPSVTTTPTDAAEVVTHNDLYARFAGVTTNESDLNELEDSAQHRVTLPGVSGIPVRLLHHPDTAATALRAAEKVYDMYLEQLGVDAETRKVQAAELAKRSTETMRNLFSGEKDTNPDGARVASIQALKTAATLYTELVQGAVESIPQTNGNNETRALPEAEESLFLQRFKQLPETASANIPPEQLQEATTQLHAAYPPDVASKLSSIYTRLTHLTDEELADSCNDVQELVEKAVGFDFEFGTFKLDKPKDGILYYPHVSPVDAQGRRLDMSLRQFNPYLNKENQIDPSTVVIDRNHPSWDRFQPIHDEY